MSTSTAVLTSKLLPLLLIRCMREHADIISGGVTTELNAFERLKLSRRYFVKKTEEALSIYMQDESQERISGSRVSGEILFLGSSFCCIKFLAEKNGVVRNDLLNCLTELRKRGKIVCKESSLSTKNSTKDATFQIDGDDFVAQAMAFLLAGFETSANILCFALYELALHPQIQHTLRAEIMRVLNKQNGEVTYDGIQEMSYLDRVVSETLRKYPILPFLDRNCCSDYELPATTGNGTVTLPAGTAVYISLLALQHDPTYFPEPQKFDPDRFTEENKHSRPNYTYLPFGEGPRMCLGTRFGHVQVKTGLCHILSRFEVATCKNTPQRVVFDTKSFELKTDGEMALSFKPTTF